MSAGSTLYLDGVSVVFDGFRALNNLSLVVEPGELRAVIGPNGAGKTTMMDVITGKTRPTAGTVRFRDHDLTRLDEAAIARRASQELGLQVAGLRPALPGYRYRAEFRGVVENEVCPVYLGRFRGSPAPDPDEVGEWELLEWAAFRERQETEDGEAWSPWCREQARLIEEAGLVPVG